MDPPKKDSEKPCLLTIPREIRNQIYGYLTQTVNIIATDCLPEEPFVRTITVEVAPLLSVLLTHSRIYEEYLESDLFSSISIQIEVWQASDNMFRVDPPEVRRKVDKILSLTTRASVRFYDVYHEDAWHLLDPLAQLLTKSAPNLEAISLWIDDGSDGSLWSSHRLLGREMQVVNETLSEPSEVYESIPPFGRLSLRYEVKGVGYQYDPPDLDGSWPICPSKVITRAWLFALPDANEPLERFVQELDNFKLDKYLKVICRELIDQGSKLPELIGKRMLVRKEL